MTEQDTQLDYLIVGAGPAGVQLAYFLTRLGVQRNFVIVEANDDVGSFFKVHPRHGTLISINKMWNTCDDPDYALRHDWNSLVSDDAGCLFTDYSEEFFPPRDTLVTYLSDFANKYDLRKYIHFNTRVTNIAKDSAGVFHVATSGKQYTAKVVIMATGAMKEHIPNIPGMEKMPSYADHDLDRKKYRRKKVLIIGKGNSAFETADHLSAPAGHLVVINRSPTRLAWDTHFVGDLRAVNNNFLDMVRLKSNHSLENWQPIKCKVLSELPEGEVAPSASGTCGRDPNEKFKYAVTVKANNGAEFDFIADEVIRCTGWDYINMSMFDASIQPDTWKDGRLPTLNKHWESTNVSDLYFAGTVMQSCDRKSASGFIHGFRYLCRTLLGLLERKYFAAELPCTRLAYDLAPVTDLVCERLSHSSALWQLFSFLVDVVVFDTVAKTATYYKELRADGLEECGVMDSTKVVMIIRFDFGEKRYEDAEEITSFGPVTPAQHPGCGLNIHPVVDAYVGGKLVQTLHLRVTLDGHWSNPDSKAAVSHFVNNHTKLSEVEPNARAPFDYFKTPDAQQLSSDSTATPAENEQFYRNNGFIIAPGASLCSMPTGAMMTPASA